MDSKDLISRIEGELGSAGGPDQPSSFHPPPRVPDHELIRRIGAGSYGEVWLARSITGQWRAVKAVSRDRFSSERPYEREFRGVVQFEPISRSHPSLVHVLHVGRDETIGAFYYVMELAEDATEAVVAAEPGASLAVSLSPLRVDSFVPRTLRSDLKRRGRLSVAEAIRLGVDLAGALGHIHRHGLVHRDVKPSNVIYVQGQPKLADLGLVTHSSEARSFVGTEGFIPPEGPGTVKADLFALGRLLYEAVTGKDRCEFPELPADLDSWPDREAFLEFNEVVTQLCAPELQRRYANAAEVAGDLNLILAGRSVRRANGIERRLRQARRISAMTLVGLVLAGGVMWLQQSRQQETELRAARERMLRERAEHAERTGQQLLYTALLEQARAIGRSSEVGHRTKALEAVRQAATLTNTAELRREALTALTLPDLRWQRTVSLGADATQQEPDPGFTRIAVARGAGVVEIRTFPELSLLDTLPASERLICSQLQWSDDGRYIAVVRSLSNFAPLADIDVWEFVPDPRLILAARQVARNGWCFRANPSELLAIVSKNTLVRWDLTTGKERERRALDFAPTLLACSSDSQSLAAFQHEAEGSRVSVHDLESLVLKSQRIFQPYALALAWHPRDQHLAVTDVSGGVQLMNPTNGTVQLLGRHRDEALFARFDPTGHYLVTAGRERSSICWDLQTLNRAFGIELNSSTPRFSQDGAWFVNQRGAEVELYALERPDLTRSVAMETTSRLRRAAFSPDGRWLAAASSDQVAVCDLRSGLVAYGTCESPHLFWAVDGKELFASSSRGRSARWRVVPAGGANPLPRLESIPFAAPKDLISISVVSNRVLWTTAYGSQRTTVSALAPSQDGWKPTLAGINGQSPDGRWLGIYNPGSGNVNVYGWPDFTLATVITNEGRLAGFTFSPAGDELAVVSRTRADIYSTSDWQRQRSLTNVVDLPYWGALYQPDGRSLWLADNYHSASLRDAKSFAPQLPLPIGHFPLALSVDGQQLAVSVDSRRIEIWDLTQVRRHLRELNLDW